MLGEAHVMHRDDQCANDVNKMMMLRRFEQEFIAYGTICWEPDKRPQYMASMQADKVYHHMEALTRAGGFALPVSTYVKRTLVPAGMDEVIPQATKYLLLGQMKNDFGAAGLIEKLEHFFLTEPNDRAYEILEAEKERIDGYYDDRQLQIFYGEVLFAYRAKILSHSHFRELLNWIERIRREMEDNPIPGDLYKRTFYGFIYESGSGIMQFVDAKEDAVLQKWEAMICEGKLVGPILKKVYFFNKFTMIKDIRKSFKDYVMEDAEDCLSILHRLKELPGVIEETELTRLQEEIGDNTAVQRTVAYYKTIWNMK